MFQQEGKEEVETHRTILHCSSQKILLQQCSIISRFQHLQSPRNEPVLILQFFLNVYCTNQRRNAHPTVDIPVRREEVTYRSCRLSLSRQNRSSAQTKSGRVLNALAGRNHEYRHILPVQGTAKGDEPILQQKKRSGEVIPP